MPYHYLWQWILPMRLFDTRAGFKLRVQSVTLFGKKKKKNPQTLKTSSSDFHFEFQFDDDFMT